MESTDKNIDLLIPKIINTLKIINDYNNNKLDNQTNISPIELITKKISLISIKNKDKIQKQSTPLKNKIEDDEPETEIEKENENENEKYNLKKRFEEMKRRNNELYEDLKKRQKYIYKYNKNKNDFEKEINKLKIIFLNSKDVQDIKKKKNKINKLSGSFKLILTKILQFKSYILKGEDIEKVINEKIEIIEKKFNEIKREKNFKNKDRMILNNICRINNKIISTKLDELEHFIKLMNFNKNLYEKTQKEIEDLKNEISIERNNINIPPYIDQKFLRESNFIGISEERIKNIPKYRFEEDKEPKLLKQNWNENCDVYDDYDIHDIHYVLKAVDLPPNMQFDNASIEFDNDVKILEFEIDDEKNYTYSNRILKFEIKLENLQSKKIHFKYKDTHSTKSNEENNNYLIKKKMYGIKKDLSGENATFILKIQTDYVIISFENEFFIKNKKNEYIWGGKVPPEGKTTLITMSKLRGKFNFNLLINQQILNASINSIENGKIIIPTPFFGGNNKIVNINCICNDNDNDNDNDIILKNKGKICEINFNNNIISELEIEIELINQCKGEWICDLTDETIDEHIPIDYKNKKEQFKKYALDIIEDYDKKHNKEIIQVSGMKNKNLIIQLLDIVKIGRWINEKLANNCDYNPNNDFNIEDFLNGKIGASDYHSTQVFNTLIYSLGYKVIFISGYMVKNDNIDNIENEDEHFWSLIKINEKWLPFDVTCGYFTGKLPISHVFYRFFDNNENDNENIINEINGKCLGEINETKYLEMNMKKDLENIIKKKYLIFNKKNENYIDKLEYIKQLDTYIKNEIEVNENINNNNLILWKRAINDKKNYITRFLGYLGSELSLKYLIQTYIEINPTNDILRDISFKILSTEFATQKLYKISIRNKDLIKNFQNSTEKWFEYLEYLKKRIASMYNIAEIDICFYNHNHLNLEVNMLFFNKKNNNMKIIINKEVEVKSYKLLNNIILSNNIFDIKNSKNKNEWSRKKLYRGGINYYPPYGWIGIALKIKNKYEKYNDDLWLGKENIEGEWPVAYKGVDGNIFSIVLNIINNNFKIENNENNIKNKNVNNKVYENDIVLYPNINDAMNYAQFINFGKEKIQLKFVIMARVNPNKIGRLSNSIWFLNGNDKDIRPYRLLIKEQIYK